jgi:uncharacterized cupredoxin-like copper-binding protein
MTKISNLLVASATLSVLLLTAAQSRADTMINVVESGEGGGAMTLTLDQTTVRAGPAVFNVKNDAATEEHEMVVVRLKSADQKIPLNKAKHRVNENKLKSIGEVSGLKPGAAGRLKVDLKPGTYLLICNIKSHYEAGMFAKLVVTP